jgi:phosphoglycolate phosphatase-like HAD superfamily hydrolase
MIGDTEADIIAAQAYNVPAIAVLSGIRNLTQLEKYKPNQIVANLICAIDKVVDL